MEALARLDASENLTVHINGESRNIPQQADVQVTVVEGYVPLQKLVKRGQPGSSEAKRMRSQRRRMAKFRRRISLASLDEEFRRLAATVNAAGRPRTLEYPCSR
ncbi:hypothetical protein BsWGS_12221 [Bradybaena similaris]